jgi:iron complex outermembrane receptor protein
LASDPPLATPKWKWNVGAQYEIPMGDMGSITPRVDVAYTGRIYAGPDTVSVAGSRMLMYIPSYTLVNARLTWRGLVNGLDVSLEARNLFKEYYYLQLFDLRSAGSGSQRALVGEPRTVALTIKKKF